MEINDQVEARLEKLRKLREMGINPYPYGFAFTHDSARLIEQKDAQYFGLQAKLRGLPLIDLAAPPTKIQQISLPDLTINYNFKEVPRYDRCTTCHQGIDRIGYDKTANGEPMTGKTWRMPELVSTVCSRP